MDIRQLRYFLAIAKEGQITRAAKALNMEQPPLSRQLKLMEQELGVLLFERTGKQLILTQAGKILQKKAENIIHQLNETITEVQELDQGLRGTLSIGSVFSCVSLLPEKIKQFREAYPDVIFQILEGGIISRLESYWRIEVLNLSSPDFHLSQIMPPLNTIGFVCRQIPLWQ